MCSHEALARRYPVVVLPDPVEEGFIAEVPDLPQVCAGGDTPEEALQCAYDGIATILEDMSRDGEVLPAPSSSARQAA